VRDILFARSPAVVRGIARKVISALSRLSDIPDQIEYHTR